jgi:hypothetical protein
MAITWESLNVIFSLIQTVVIVLTIGFAILEIKQLRRSHKLEVFVKLFDELSSPVARKNRVFIYSLKNKKPSELTTDDFLVIDEVLSSLDRAWILVQHKQIDEKFLYDVYGVIFLKIWSVVEPIVIHERKRRGDYYRKRAESLVCDVKNYFKQQSLPLEYPIK